MFAHPRHLFAFLAQAVADGTLIGQGVAAAGFFEPAAKDFVVTIQKQQGYVRAGALHQMIQFVEKPGGVEIAGADVDADGMGKIPVRDQPADQGYRQIVHRLIT